VKVLLVGEFSGVHTNLRLGLLKLGIKARLLADGDGYRSFPSDHKINPFRGSFTGKVLNIINMLINIKNFINYDIVQFISPFALPWYFYYFGIFHILFNRNKRIVYYACGTDPAFLKSKRMLKYHPFDNEKSHEYPNYNKYQLKVYDWFIQNVNIIIPSNYTYSIGYRGNYNSTHPILLPGKNERPNINISQNEKIVIIYGITRKNFKGSYHIEKALQDLHNKYHGRVEIKIIEKLSFNEYYSFIQQADILIDQCKSYDYGMNAVFALENGLIVFSGAETSATHFLKLKSCPVINITPDDSQIFNEIEKVILEGRENIECRKIFSRKFAHQYHDNLMVAQKFITEYSKP
jgi:hypothetical protein